MRICVINRSRDVVAGETMAGKGRTGEHRGFCMCSFPNTIGRTVDTFDLTGLCESDAKVGLSKHRNDSFHVEFAFSINNHLPPQFTVDPLCLNDSLHFLTTVSSY